MPPGRTRAAAACSSSSWSSGSGCERQRRSGRAARTPSPEQGASTSARSNPVSSSGSARPSAQTTRTFVAPSRATFSSSSRARASFTSTATTSPASIVALPPGAAQRSSTRSPATDADREPGELRAGALRPDAALGERRLVDVLDVPGSGDVRIGHAVDLAADEPDDGRRCLVLGAHQRQRALRAEVAPPRLGDPVRVRVRDGGLLPRRVRQRLDARAALVGEAAENGVRERHGPLEPAPGGRARPTR